MLQSKATHKLWFCGDGSGATGVAQALANVAEAVAKPKHAHAAICANLFGGFLVDSAWLSAAETIASVQASLV